MVWVLVLAVAVTSLMSVSVKAIGGTQDKFEDLADQALRPTG